MTGKDGPASPAQVAALNNTFWYLGLRRGLDHRAERLSLCAAILRLDELQSTKHLTDGQAGLLVRQLADVASLDELRHLAERAGRRGQADEADAAAELEQQPAAELEQQPAAAGPDKVPGLIVAAALAWGCLRDRRAIARYDLDEATPPGAPTPDGA